MRLSRVLLAGVAVAGAVATTSAFTAGNNTTGVTADEKVAGYGSVVVSGVVVTDVKYNPFASDASKLANVVFTTSDNVTTQYAWLTLKNGATQIGSYNDCAMGPYASGSMTITCSVDTSGAGVGIASFDTVGLTVSHADDPTP